MSMAWLWVNPCDRCRGSSLVRGRHPNPWSTGPSHRHAPRASVSGWRSFDRRTVADGWTSTAVPACGCTPAARIRWPREIPCRTHLTPAWGHDDPSVRRRSRGGSTCEYRLRLRFPQAARPYGSRGHDTENRRQSAAVRTSPMMPLESNRASRSIGRGGGRSAGRRQVGKIAGDLHRVDLLAELSADLRGRQKSANHLLAVGVTFDHQRVLTAHAF